MTRSGAGGSVQQPFSRETLFHQVGPLVGGTLMGLLFLAATHMPQGHPGLILRAAALTAIAATATAIVPWRRIPPPLQATPALLYLLVAFLLARATGGVNSAYEQLMLLPILWLAVYASGFELTLGVVAAAAALVLPVIGTPASSPGFTRAFMLAAVAAILGFSVHRILTQIRNATTRLDMLARTDDLTGVANRRAWDEYLYHVLLRAKEEQFPVALAILDVDHFKEYNDQHGHQAGDRFLKELTARWRSRLRDRDVLARLGGDEFAMVLPGAELTAAHRILNRLATDLPYGQACSAGLAAWDGEEGAEALIARADEALYEAKKSGRARVILAGRRPGAGLP